MITPSLPSIPKESQATGRVGPGWQLVARRLGLTGSLSVGARPGSDQQDLHKSAQLCSPPVSPLGLLRQSAANDQALCTRRSIASTTCRPAAWARLRPQRRNKQRKDEVLIYVHDVALGHNTKMRWNDAGQWICSDQVVHPPIIGPDTFARAQAMLKAKTASAERSPRRSPRPYSLRGLLFCGICGRRMQGSWNNDAAYYRCALGSSDDRWLAV